MATAQNLKDVYADEMKDLWSANDQMVQAVKMMAGKAHDHNLKHALELSLTGITKHTETLMSLITQSGAQVEQEKCRGMEGLVLEATKHLEKEPPTDSDLRDVVIISQYQRMSQYGLAGFGCAAAYAKALGLKEHVTKLKAIVSDIYKADDYASKLAEKAEKIAPKA